MTDLLAALMKKISVQNGCWGWLAATGGLGYGRMFWNGKTRRAHRLMWEAVNGEIPEGMCVLHSCDNPPCANPDHLFLGTHKDNAQDRDAKGRRFDKTGTKYSAESCERISKALKGKGLGRKLPPFTVEHRARLSASHRGKTLSPEHRAKISASVRATKNGLNA